MEDAVRFGTSRCPKYIILENVEGWGLVSPEDDISPADTVQAKLHASGFAVDRVHLCHSVFTNIIRKRTAVSHSRTADKEEETKIAGISDSCG